jgi:hypothetical protein
MPAPPQDLGEVCRLARPRPAVELEMAWPRGLKEEQQYVEGQLVVQVRVFDR